MTNANDRNTMTYPIRFTAAGRKATGLLVSGLALLAAVLAIYPSGASASTNSYSGKNLPGGTWTTGNGVVLSKEFLIGGGANTTSSVCVGPVTHDGSGFHTPYGWSCATRTKEWFFASITAAAGFYNPNPGTFGEYSVNAFGE
jgi:hypothetical protein